MYNTYKMLHSCSSSYYEAKTLEELVELYKGTENMSKKNKIVSAMFIKVYPMILKIQERYYSLTNEQKVDIALYHLVRSIKRYKGGNKVKFSSFFYTHLSNMMKTNLTAENSLKRAAFQNIVRDNENVLNWYCHNEEDNSSKTQDEYFVKNLQTSLHLSEEEKQYCQCVLDGYTKTRDIAKQMNPSVVDIKKVATNPMNIYDDKKLEDKQQKKIRDIKKSLKQKYATLGNAMFY